MQTEFEATILDIEVNEVREKLKKLNAKLIQPERLMRRYNFAPHDEKGVEGAWVRVRDESDKVTMSFKRIEGNKIEDQKEVCLTIDSFDEGCVFLKEIGLEQKAYQETKREFWLLKDVEVTIDTWPGLESFLEIEGQGEVVVKEVVEMLGYDYDKAIFGAVDVIYEMKLGIPPSVINNGTPEITFENPPKKYEV
mgnify:CR=1 FL=1|jgi:adenylate cyclase, class 2